MVPFDDEGYLVRREKQIEEIYVLRATTAACVVTAALTGVIAAVLLNAGHETLGAILLVFALLFGAGSIFMTATYFAMQGADRAIRAEHERLLMLYGDALEKPKRGVPALDSVPDDGELPLVEREDDLPDDLADQLEPRSQRGQSPG